MLVETAAVLEQRLNDPSGALSILSNALLRDWRNLELAGEVARLAQVTVSEQEVLAGLEKQFKTIPADDGFAFYRTIDVVIARFEQSSVDDEMRLALGDHYRHFRADYATAAKHYALVAGAFHVDGLLRLCETLRHDKQWSELAIHLECHHPQPNHTHFLVENC